jgi:hypothetical protein
MITLTVAEFRQLSLPVVRDFSLIPTGFRRNPLLYRRLAMILGSISGGQSLGKPLPELSRQGQSLCEGPFSVSCRKSKPFKPSDAVGFDEKSPSFFQFARPRMSLVNRRRRPNFSAPTRMVHEINGRGG